MNARRSWVLVVLVSLAGTAGSAQPRAPTPTPAGTVLRFQFVPGQRTVYAARTVQTVPAGQTVVTFGFELETLRVHADGAADQRMRLTRIDVASAALPPAARARIARGLGGLTVEYTQNARGQVTARQPPANVDREVRALVEAILQSIDQLVPALPEGPVAVGATWTERAVIHLALGPGMDVDLHVESSYTLRELRARAAGSAVIDVVTTLGTPTGSNVSGVPVVGSGGATGTVTLDLARGVLSQSHTAGTMTMQVSPAGRSVEVRTRFENDLRVQPSRR